jgi:hypothetical protein
VQKILKPRRKTAVANRQPQLSRFFLLGEHHTLPSHRLSFPSRFSSLITLGAATLFSAVLPKRRSRARKLMNGMQQAPDFIQLPPDSPSADSGRHGTISRDHYVSFQNL